MCQPPGSALIKCQRPSGIRRSTFDVRRSTFDVRRSTFDVRCSMFDVRCSMFDVRCSMFDVRRSTFDVRRSTFDVRCSMFDVQSCAPERDAAPRGGTSNVERSTLNVEVRSVRFNQRFPNCRSHEKASPWKPPGSHGDVPVCLRAPTAPRRQTRGDTTRINE